MTDIDIAKQHLFSNNLSLVVVKNGEIIKESTDKGIRPLLNSVKTHGLLQGASVADKVTGKAAAMLLQLGGVKELYTELISEDAEVFLRDVHIKYAYGKKVPNILNRDKTGLCPMEGLSSKAKDAEELVLLIEEFFRNILK